MRVEFTGALPRGQREEQRQLRWTDYEGLEVAQHRPRDDSPREDRTWSLSPSLHKRDFTVYGFSPQLVVTHEERESNAWLISDGRTHGELRFVCRLRAAAVLRVADVLAARRTYFTI